MMEVLIRPATPQDTAECGRILFTAFATAAEHHRFSPEFPSREDAMKEIAVLIGHPDFHGVVAEQGGRILGSNFVEIRSPIAGIGPVTVDPEVQNKGVGRRLMQALIDHANNAGAVGIRLSHAAYNNRAFCLYTSLGFRPREPLLLLQGASLQTQLDGYAVRPAVAADLESCNRLCRTVHGFGRDREVQDALGRGEAMVVERLGQITGYSTGIGFFSHAAARTHVELQALIGAAKTFPGPGFLLPARNYELAAWCLDNGLRLVMQATLLTMGLYHEPDGVWLPSSQY